MMTIIKKLTLLSLAALLILSGCKKQEYAFGDIKTPKDLTLTAVIAGVDVSNPNGNGTGNVTITTTSSGAITYNIDYGDGTSKVVPSGTIVKKYTTPGTNSYTITVNAIGTGGATSTISKRITVFVAFEIPAAVLNPLTGTGSKIWVTDNNAPGHFGVGPNTEFSPIWYAAGPNSREPCAYDDEITFSRDVLNRVSMTIDNKGTSFSIGAATGVYGFSGGDGCYAVNTGGTRPLAFMDATSGSTPAVSTQIQFTVPGNGIINFGTGGTTYEILSISNTSLHLRNIGADGNSWYQKLKPKP
jgi:hypothetical protein